MLTFATATTTEPLFLLDERGAARFLGLQPRTLQAWRHSGGGPPYVVISSRCIRYRIADLEAFAADRVRASTSDRGAADQQPSDDAA
jgi:hypothetical protein